MLLSSFLSFFTSYYTAAWLIHSILFALFVGEVTVGAMSSAGGNFYGSSNERFERSVDNNNNNNDNSYDSNSNCNSNTAMLRSQSSPILTQLAIDEEQQRDYFKACSSTLLVQWNPLSFALTHTHARTLSPSLFLPFPLDGCWQCEYWKCSTNGTRALPIFARTSKRSPPLQSNTFRTFQRFSLGAFFPFVLVTVLADDGIQSQPLWAVVVVVIPVL